MTTTLEQQIRERARAAVPVRAPVDWKSTAPGALLVGRVRSFTKAAASPYAFVYEATPTTGGAAFSPDRYTPEAAGFVIVDEDTGAAYAVALAHRSHLQRLAGSAVPALAAGERVAIAVTSAVVGAERVTLALLDRDEVATDDAPPTGPLGDPPWSAWFTAARREPEAEIQNRKAADQVTVEIGKLRERISVLEDQLQLLKREGEQRRADLGKLETDLRVAGYAHLVDPQAAPAPAKPSKPGTKIDPWQPPPAAVALLAALLPLLGAG